MEQSTGYFLFCGQDIIAPDRGDSAAFEGAVPLELGRRARMRRDYGGLGAAQGGRFTALLLDEESVAALEGVRRVALRQALSQYDAVSIAGALRGAALLRWLEVAQYCGACGGQLADVEGKTEPEYSEATLCRTCTSCGRLFFPRISPAVIVLVQKEGRILLAHNARFPAGRFGLIAGYAEAGESLEEAAVREVREEAGIEIQDLRYVKSQSWPFPDSLMIAFTAEWKSGEARPDGFEIEELRWCGPDDLPDIPPPGSVARYLIDRFVQDKS
jgi:NAD+ diphosphatase